MTMKQIGTGTDTIWSRCVHNYFVGRSAGSVSAFPPLFLQKSATIFDDDDHATPRVSQI